LQRLRLDFKLPQSLFWPDSIRRSHLRQRLPNRRILVDCLQTFSAKVTAAVLRHMVPYVSFQMPTHALSGVITIWNL
jgi:hypothetical protein